MWAAIFKTDTILVGEVEARTSKNSTNHFYPFQVASFLIQCSLGCCKSLFTKVLTKLVLTVFFLIFFLCFYGQIGSWGLPSPPFSRLHYLIDIFNLFILKFVFTEWLQRQFKGGSYLLFLVSTYTQMYVYHACKGKVLLEKLKEKY